MRLFTTAIALLAATAGLAQAQVPVKSGMTADSFCIQSQNICFTALYTPDTQMINYTLVVPQGPNPVGWYGVAQGTQMVDANMAINWALNGQTTTSHRSTNAQVMPLESEVMVQSFSRNSDVSGTANGISIWSWNMPVPSGESMSSLSHVMAIANVAPSSSATDATIQKHYETFTDINLDLTKAYTGSAPAGLSGSTQTFGSSSAATNGDHSLNKNYARIYLVHMIFMVIGWQLCFPLGILIARYGRTFFTWFPVHRAFQSAGILLVFIAFFLAVAGVSMQGIPHFGTTHQKLGLALFILMLVQGILGVTAHSLKQRRGLRHIGFVHIPLGLTLYGLSVWNIHEGFAVWQWNPPAYASYIIYAWAGLMALLYFVGLLLVPKERRLAREHSNPTKHELSSETSR